MSRTAGGQWDVPQNPRSGALMTQTYDLGAARLQAFAAATDVPAGFPFADAHPNHIGARCMLHREVMLEREDLFASCVLPYITCCSRKASFPALYKVRTLQRASEADINRRGQNDSSHVIAICKR